MTPGGDLLGYAKVGWNDLTARLVDNEADALRRLAGSRPRSFEVPSLIHHGRWAGKALLLVSPGPRPILRRCRRNQPLPMAAQREVARTGWWTAQPLAGSAFASSLSDRLAHPGNEPSVATRARDCLTHLTEDAGSRPIRFGAWHGDWAPWNATRQGGRLFVWDWERYGGPVPVGFDEAHQGIQVGVAAGASRAAEAASAAVRRLERLPEVRAEGPEAARLIVRLYLLERVVRAEEGRRAGVPMRVGVATRFLDLAERGDLG
jgi:hypothetical protein